MSRSRPGTLAHGVSGGRTLLILSLLSRTGVLLLLILLALWTEYLNFKIGHNNPRLVELSAGRAMRIFYEASDNFFSFFRQ